MLVVGDEHRYRPGGDIRGRFECDEKLFFSLQRLCLDVGGLITYLPAGEILVRRTPGGGIQIRDIVHKVRDKTVLLPYSYRSVKDDIGPWICLHRQPWKLHRSPGKW